VRGTTGAAGGAVPPLVLTWMGPFRVKVGEEFNVVLRVNSTADVRSLPLEIRFDPHFIDLYQRIWDTLRDEVRVAYARQTTATTPAS